MKLAEPLHIVGCSMHLFVVHAAVVMPVDNDGRPFVVDSKPGIADAGQAFHVEANTAWAEQNEQLPLLLDNNHKTLYSAALAVWPSSRSLNTAVQAST